MSITTNGPGNTVTNALANGAGSKIIFAGGGTLNSTGAGGGSASTGDFGLWALAGGQITGGNFNITMAGVYSAAVYALGNTTTDAGRGTINIGNLTAVINNRGYGIRAYQGGVVTAGQVNITAGTSSVSNAYGIVAGQDGQNYTATPDRVTIAGGVINVKGLSSASGIWAGSASTVTVTGDITISSSTLTSGRGIDVSNSATVNMNGNTTITTNGSSGDGLVIGSTAGVAGGTINSLGQMNVHTTGSGSYGLHLKLDGATYNAASASSSTILSADKGSAIVFEVGRNMSADINQASLVTGGAFDLIGVSNGADNAVLSLHNSSNIVANSGAALVNQTSTGSFALNADNTQMKGAIVTTAGSTTATLDNNSVWTLAARGTNPSVMRNNTLSTLNINGNSTLDASGGNFVINGPGSNLTTAKVNNLAGTINLYNAAGQTGSVLTIGGDWTQGSAGTLNILGDNGSAKMVTNNANLAGTLAIFNPYLTVPTKASLVGAEQIHVVQSNNAITGDFDQIQMTLATPDYLYYAGHKNNSDLNYDVGLAMSWFRGATDGHGTFTLPNATDTFEIDIPLPDQAASATGWDGTTLTKQGAGTLILSAPNAYTGATEINGGHVMLQGAGDIATSRAVQLNVADAVLDVSGITAAETTLQNLFGVAGSQLVRVDREVTLANSTNTVFAGDFDASTATLTKTGTGALTLSGQTAWTGQTLVQQGTLILDGIQGKARLTSDVGGDSNAVLALQNGAVLTGEIQEPRLTIDGHSVWNMTASSTVAALSHAGTINIAPPGLGGFKTLTVLGGNYVGLGGRVNMSTFLGTDGSPSDKIVINGGTATGTTSLRITNAGGAGALTIGNGILVVDTINGGTSQTGAFGLNGRAVAGAYEYLLFRGSVDASNPDAWYLRSAQPAPPPPGPTPPTPSPSPPSPQPLYRPEVGAYLSNQRVAAGMLVQSLHDRLGEPQWSEQQTFSDDDSKRRSVWLRFVGKDIGSRSSDSNFDVSSDVFLLQGGADIATWSLFRGDDRLHVGAMLGYGWASSDASAKGNPFTATADVNGVSVGAYGTWFQNDESRLGWYTDLWAQYGWFTNHVTGQDLPSVGYHSEVLALSAEAGYAWYPFPQLDWVIEPQGQVIYEHGFESGFDEPNGTHIDGARGSGWITRLGVRFHRTWMDTAGKRYQPYVTLNWWHDAIDNVVAFNQVSMRDLYPENRYEIKLGIDIEGKKGWTGWSNVGWQVGSQSYHAFIGRIGVKKTW